MPSRAPAAGEQYRFHIDMDRCIGCKCCVVACNEQNGNPAEVNWRRVADAEAGIFPAAHRFHFSMGCNHCADPTCLAGCPVDAYTKDASTGIVRHSAETCIGCQYCTWTCSYGVPQFNPARGVVGKCDMCHGRLSLGQAPACVSACPEGALAIEIVNVAEWRAEVAAGAVGFDGPSNDASTSTTRVTRPASLTSATRPAAAERVEPGEPHVPLVAMTVLTQMSVGALAATWIAQLTGATSGLVAAAATALAVCGFALALAPLHLGRPIHAYRALKMWRRSWLSREALVFTVFVNGAAVYAAGLWRDWPMTAAVGGVATALGLAGLFASARIYLVPSRPAWDSPRTIADFYLTGAVLGPLLAAATGAGSGAWCRVITMGAATASGALVIATHRRWAASRSRELQGAVRLLAARYRLLAAMRLAALGVGGVMLPALSGSPAALAMALVLTLAAEFAGRYLFFVTAVPRHMTAPYLAQEPEAA